jgi:dihydroceramidase
VSGLWESALAPASVDWCEPNYAVLSGVAEFWNTLSSLVMVVLGVAGLWRWWSGGPSPERRFAWGFAGLALVGAGSAAFHGTLTRGAQALDELPMVWLGLVGVWIVQRRDHPRQGPDGMAAAMSAYAVVFTLAYLLATDWFTLFVLTYAGLVAWTVIRSARHTWLQPSTEAMRTLFVAAALTYLGSLSLCWVPEHVLLPCDHPAQAAQLHAWWHLGAGFGTYLWLLWAMADRRNLEGVVLRVVGRWPPRVEV